MAGRVIRGRGEASVLRGITNVWRERTSDTWASMATASRPRRTVSLACVGNEQVQGKVLVEYVNYEGMRRVKENVDESKLPCHEFMRKINCVNSRMSYVISSCK